MDEHKGFLHHLGEAIDAYRTERRARAAAVTSPANRLNRFLRWMVPNGGTILLVLVLILTQQVWARPAQQQVNAPGPSATTVNYQGRLADPVGNPLDGSYAMSFSLWDAPSGGSPVWGPENHPAVPVSGGLFSVGLGSQTSGGIPTTTWDGDRYLEITVGGETLSPRELIRSVPIAGMALTVPDGAITTAKIAEGAIGAAQVEDGAITTAKVAEGAVTSSKLGLSRGTVCLPTHVDLTFTSYTPQDIPGLSLDFTLASPSAVLVWLDGAALPNDGASAGEASVTLYVDGTYRTSSLAYTGVDYWFNIKGQRILELESGTHTMVAKAQMQHPGTMRVHGIGALKTCINYLVLGEQ